MHFRKGVANPNALCCWNEIVPDKNFRYGAIYCSQIHITPLLVKDEPKVEIGTMMYVTIWTLHIIVIHNKKESVTDLIEFLAQQVRKRIALFVGYR